MAVDHAQSDAPQSIPPTEPMTSKAPLLAHDEKRGGPGALALSADLNIKSTPGLR